MGSALLLYLLIAFVAYFLGFWSWAWKWLQKPFGWSKRPSGVNFAVTQDYAATYWQEGGRGGIPHMIVVCTLHITNSGPVHLGQIVDVYIKSPLTHTNNHINTDVVYPSGIARTVTFTFEITPPAAQSGKQFVAAVVLVDQFGGKHTAENVVFKTFGMQVWSKN
jgi:hypothetical protein